MKATKVLLTGDRPTGNLHIGHYIGSLRQRVEMQNSGNYEPYILIADAQALTDNADNPEKVRTNIIEVCLDYLGVGIDPTKSTIGIQSHIYPLTELTFYYMNLVTLARLQRNPTVKAEMKQKNYGANVPVGFLTYPISQAADITAFNAQVVPVGEDQLPVIEQTCEIVNSFNRIYGETLVTPKAILDSNTACRRLVGLDGNAKMSKSLGNTINLKDEPDVIKQKVMSMYTDPNHIRIEDAGKVEGNTVFAYLDAFSTDLQIEALSEYKTLDEMKEHYRKGGLGDVKIKKILNEILQTTLTPIRERRKQFENDKSYVMEILKQGSDKMLQIALNTLNRVKTNMGINYFNDNSFFENYLK